MCLKILPLTKHLIDENSFTLSNKNIYCICCFLSYSLGFGQSGSLDPSFGSGGIVITDYPSADDDIHAIIMQPDGKIWLQVKQQAATMTLV